MAPGLLLVALAAIAGCEAAPPADGGMGLPQQLAGEHYPGARRHIDGILRVGAEGCAYLAEARETRLAIWPAGSELSAPVRLPDGTELADGAALEATGTTMAAGALPGGPDGYWAMVTGFCDAGMDEVVVLDRVSVRR